MSKSSFLSNKKLEKSNIALICILVMIAGFLVSRVALSISMFVFGINAIRDVPPRQWLRQKWWLVGVAWVAIYALTYFWSDDKGNWDVRWQVKLPFLILPLAFAYLPSFSPRQIWVLTLSIGFMFLAAACYSVYFLASDPAYYIFGYRISHILPTLPKNDHIRCSLAMALFIIWCVYIWPLLQDRVVKWITAIIVLLLVAYLHLLAAKSGLISLYLFLIGWSFYILFVKKKLAGLVVIIAMPLFFVLAVRNMPTFRERVNYVGFSYERLQKGDTSGNYGDIARLMSYKIAFRLISKHPIAGVGAGDMQAEMNKGYDQWYPNMPPEGRILPHNQFLTVALGCGIPAMLLFIVWVFMPLASLRRNRQSFFFFIVWLILFLQLMIEPVLEVQFGVFVYLFFLLLQKRELTSESEFTGF